jgi:hypothetical protein
MEHQPKIEKFCKVCGKKFLVYAYRNRNRPSLHCSMQCVLASRRKPVQMVPCGTCKKQIRLSPWQVKRASKLGHFCSNKCYGEWRSLNLVGEDSPQWKGGLAIDYGAKLWKAQRAKARTRDGNKCVKCGSDGGGDSKRLHVHHIKPFDMFEDPKKAHALKNLITLCPSCHAAEHQEIRNGTANA